MSTTFSPILRREINSTPLLSAEEERELLAKSLRGDAAARDLLVRSNLRFVIRYARDFFRSRKVPFEDVIQQGLLGLIRAIDKFDLNQNVRLVNYASWWIRQTIDEHVHTRAGVITLPHRRNSARMRETDQKRIYNLITNGLVQLTEGSDEPAAANNCDPVSITISNDLRRTVRRAISQLPHREKVTVYLRMREWSCAKIAELLKMSAEGVRQAELRAHARLREMLRGVNV